MIEFESLAFMLSKGVAIFVSQYILNNNFMTRVGD